MVTDKVYDRAMPIDINDKGQVFEPIDTEAQDINYSYLDKLFQEGIQNNQMSEDTLNKIEEMDNVKEEVRKLKAKLAYRATGKEKRALAGALFLCIDKGKKL